MSKTTYKLETDEQEGVKKLEQGRIYIGSKGGNMGRVAVYDEGGEKMIHIGGNTCTHNPVREYWRKMKPGEKIVCEGV